MVGCIHKNAFNVWIRHAGFSFLDTVHDIRKCFEMKQYVLLRLHAAHSELSSPILRFTNHNNTCQLRKGAEKL